MKNLQHSFFALVLGAGICAPAAAVQLDGLMTVDAMVKVQKPFLDEFGNPVFHPVTGEQIFYPGLFFDHGSYFSMGGDNPNTAASQEAGIDGGIKLGEHQPFVLSPDVPHPPGGTGYAHSPTQESGAVKTFKFFGVNTYVGLNAVSYQSGLSKPVTSAEVDALGNLSVEISSWEVMWNGSTFEQGPRPSGTNFVLATGTYDFDTGAYVLAWSSKIVGGPFSGVPGFWHLEGTILADPLNASASAAPKSLNVKSQGNGFSVSVSVEDVDGSPVSVANIEEGVYISSIGSVILTAGDISENVADRTGTTVLTAVFNDPATGDRQDIIAAVGDVEDKSSVDICVKGKAVDFDGIKRPFEACDAVKILNKGNR